MIKKITEYNFPQDLKEMDEKELELLAIQIREFLLDNVSKTGGHLASNLGVTELTIALHKYFDSPRDKIVWDVGHQCYVHKILTGRAKDFPTLRQLDGLSGFPKDHESPHDHFNTGHSSTSIALMSGMAKARDMKGEDYRTIAVIGDASLGGGPAYEALNNLGASKTKAIVVLNDNRMSIGRSTGGLEAHLSKLRVSGKYNKFKKDIRTAAHKLPYIGDTIVNGMAKVRDSLKYIVTDGVLFEELGFTYLGPVDGHDITALLQQLQYADACDEPVLLHVLTDKGKGYKNAEANPQKFHGIGPFDIETGAVLKKKTAKTWSEIFCEQLMQLAENDEKVVAISAAMVEGTGLLPFAKKYPDRIFDVGIEEAYAVSFAAGLAKSGMKPFVAIYSTFLQRAFDQIMMDVCLQKLPVVFAIDRAGNVGNDGETHHGLFDISYLQQIPNLTILAPRDASELKQMIEYAYHLNDPVAIRYPRGSSYELGVENISLDKGAQVIKEGKDCEIWAAGSMVKLAVETATKLADMGIDAGVVDPRLLKPFDDPALMASARRTKYIFTMEDNVIIGGFGERLAAKLANSDVHVKSIAWPDSFIEQGGQDELYNRYGFNADEISERIAEIIEG